MMRKDWIDRASEYLDGELSPEELSEFERELDRSEELSRVVAELRQVVKRAERLGPRPPRKGLWTEIAARIQRKPSLVGSRPSSQRVGRRYSLTLTQLVAAGLATVIVSGALAWGSVSLDRAGLVDSRDRGFPSASFAASASPEAPGYEMAISELEETLREGQEVLDSATIRVLEESLISINRAIEDARRALAADSSDLFVNRHLRRALRRKRELLQAAQEMMVAAQS